MCMYKPDGTDRIYEGHQPFEPCQYEIDVTKKYQMSIEIGRDTGCNWRSELL